MPPRSTSANPASSSLRPSSERTVAIIGAGFSGTLVAVHLLRSVPSHPLRIVLIERTGRFARGVAYSTSSTAHLLNVAAGRMSALPDEPDHFLKWAQSRHLPVRGDTFAPRAWYGEYLESLLHDSQRLAPDHISIDRVADEATDLVIDPHTGRPAVHLRTHSLLSADSVVLTMGNFPPGEPGWRNQHTLSSPAYIGDPWAAGAFQTVQPDHDVLLVGTGLTMLDVVLQLREQGHRGVIHAVSRRGLLPQAHRHPTAPPHRHFVAEEVQYWPRTALGVLRQVRIEIRNAAARGEDWREVINALRPVTQSLWTSLPIAEQRRFLSRVRPFWDTHRHRAAGDVHERVRQLIAGGWVVPLAGRIQSVEPGPDGLRIALRPRGMDQPQTLKAHHVINCTGPAPDLRSVSDPLLRNLQHRGIIRADALGLGLDCDALGGAIGSDGRANPDFTIVGPLRKGLLWESVAVPELREQAQAAARRIGQRLFAGIAC